MKNDELKTKQSKEEIKALLEIVGGDEGTLLFLEEWLKNGRNATKAYLKINPDVSYHSARTLGSRLLTKVDISVLFAAYGLGIEAYIKQLKAGLNANTGKLVEKYDKEGNLRERYDDRRPDHKTRRPYHQALGEILGFEGKQNTYSTRINIAQVWQGMSVRARERGISIEEMQST